MISQPVARGYDAIAMTYDQFVEGDRWMRSILWEHYLRVFEPGQSVLDVACGTGLDAVFLAKAGIHTVAIDVSPRMVEQVRRRVAREKLGKLIEARLVDLRELRHLVQDGETYDGIISAFAGLSTVHDLGGFAEDAARLLSPGSHLVIHLLNRFSLWEWLALMRDARWSEARRLSSLRYREFTIGGEQVTHYLYFPGEVYERYFAPYFALADAYSLGSLRPPHTLRRVPAPLVRALETLERQFSRRRPLLNWGRFFVLDLIRREPSVTDSGGAGDAR